MKESIHKYSLEDIKDVPDILLSEEADSEEKEMESKKILLKLKHIDVKFNVRGRTLNAIRDANLEIFDGETLAIVGESGSGKSVLTKTFAGMLDANGFISHGNVYFRDKSLSDTRVELTKNIKKIRDQLFQDFVEMTYLKGGYEEYNQLEKLTKDYFSKFEISAEEEETTKKALDDIDFSIVDCTNRLSVLSRRDKEELNERYEIVAKIKELKVKKKEIEKKFKSLSVERKKALKADVEGRTQYEQQKSALLKAREEKIKQFKEKGLSKKELALCRTMANEIVLSLGRYPLRLFSKYKKHLLASFKVYFSQNKDLFTGKQNRRLYEPIVFRVEYMDSDVVEANKNKYYLEHDFVSLLENEASRKEMIENDSLIDQARGLHPFIRRYIRGKLNKGVNDKNNVEEICDIILLRIAEMPGFISVILFAKRATEFAISFLNSGGKNRETNLKSNMVESLHGFAHIDCAKVRYLKDWEQIRGRRIATVFQDPMTSLDPIITIGKQIMMVIQKHQRCSAFEAKRRALSIMRKVGIPEPEKRFDDYPFQYSGGMRQRIVIAIALSCQPRILICDEPTTALDVTIQAQIIRLIKKLSKDLGFTTVYITHDLGVVANVAERVAVLYAGQIVELGTVEDIFYDPRHPYTWALLSAMPQLATSNDELYYITGTPPSLYSKIKGDAFAARSNYAMAIDFVKEPPMFKVSETHMAKTWLLDPRAPKITKPKAIENLHEKMVSIYGDVGKEEKK